MDKRCLPPMPYFDDARFAEREVGFWNLEKMTDDHGVVTDQLSWTSGNKSIASPPLGKCKQMIANSVGSMDLPESYLFGGQKGKLKLERNFEVTERTNNLSMSSRMGTEDSAARSNFHVPQVSYAVDGNKIGLNGSHSKSSLFSSSFPEIFSRNLRLPSDDVLSGQYIDTMVSHNKEDKPFGSLGEIEAQTIGNLLPDNDDLISGVLDDLKYISQPNNDDDIEYFDPFSNVGGMELEDDASCGDRHNIDVAGGISNALEVSKVSIAGEHPYVCEHPSRTLFVRNINSNFEDSELRVLFEQFGDIRTIYTDCKHSGFVVISYYDIRAACNAIRALQNKPVRCLKLDIHFSTLKDNPSGKDINQGTLVVFNIDSSVSNDYLCQIFGAYGEIKEIRETPHRHHLKFIEFYDVRAAEAAFHALRRSDISGKQFKLEPSHTRSGRQCLIQYYSPELEQDQSSHCWQNNSSPAQCSVSISYEETASSGIDNVNIQDLCSSARAPISSITKNAFHHKIPSSIQNRLPSLEGGISVGNQFVGEPSHPLGQMKFGFQSVPTVHPRSFPEYHGGVANFTPFNSSYMGANMVADIRPRPSVATWMCAFLCLACVFIIVSFFFPFIYRWIYGYRDSQLSTNF